MSRQEKNKEGDGIQVEALVPIGVESPSLDGCRLGLLSIDRGNSEWIGKPCIAKLTNHTLKTERREA